MGCLAYAHNQKRDGEKFASRSRRCAFVRYPFAKKGWTLYDLDKHDIFVSRDVTFCEDVFPFSELSTPASPKDAEYEGNQLIDYDAVLFIDSDDEVNHKKGLLT